MAVAQLTSRFRFARRRRRHVCLLAEQLERPAPALICISRFAFSISRLRVHLSNARLQAEEEAAARKSASAAQAAGKSLSNSQRSLQLQRTAATLCARREQV